MRGRPKIGACGSFGTEIRSAALSIKNQYFRRGAVSIQVDLHDALPEGSKIPSVSTLTRLFRGLDSVQKYEPNRRLPAAKNQQAQKPHDVWQMDTKGFVIYPGLGYIGTLNVKDVFSRVHTGCLLLSFDHCRSNPSSRHYVGLLRQAFSTYGLPQTIQTDRGSLFFESNVKSPFPTLLHRWIVGLGITFQHARSFRPTDQAVIERTHQTMHKQLDRKDDYPSLEALNQLAQERMHKLNAKISCSTLGMPPLVKYPNASHSQRSFSVEDERNIFDINRVVQLLSNMEWFRMVTPVKTFSLGRNIYYHINLPKQKQIRITFDPLTHNLNCYNDKELLATVPIKGLSYDELTANF